MADPGDRDQTPPRPIRRRALTIALQIAVSAGLLGALVAFADWDALGTAARTLSVGSLVTVAIVGFASQAVFVLRWRALLAALDVYEPWAHSWHVVFAGLFFGNFLPGTLGSDGVRAFALSKSGSLATTAIAAVIYDRAMQFALYVILFGLAALVPVPGFDGWLRALFIVAAVCGLAVLLLVLRRLGTLPTSAVDAGRGLLRRLWHISSATVSEIGSVHGRVAARPSAAFVFWLAGLANAALVFAIWWLALADIDSRVSPLLIVLAGSGAVLATVLPISLGGIGLYEAVGVTLLGFAGIVPAHALLAALIVRAMILLSSFVGLPSALLLWRDR